MTKYDEIRKKLAHPKTNNKATLRTLRINARGQKLAFFRNGYFSKINAWLKNIGLRGRNCQVSSTKMMDLLL